MAAKVPVTLRALLQRINRALDKEAKVLKAARTEQVRKQLGAYHVVDQRRNIVSATHVDPEKLGRTLGVLAPYEQLNAGD